MTTDTTYAGSLQPGTVIRWKDRHGEHTDEVTHTQRYGADCVMIATRTGRTLHWGTTDTVEIMDAAATAEWQDAQARREQREWTAKFLRKIADTIEELGERELTMVTVHIHYANEDTWRRAVEELDARKLTPDAGEWRAAVGEPWDATIVYLHARRGRGSDRPAVSAQLRDALVARSGGVCEMSLPGCTRVATDVSHRISRKMGGRHWSGIAATDRLSAVLHACRTCHQWCHSNPRLAYEDGLLLREGQDPTREPVLYRGGRLVLLTDDGRVVDYLTPTGEVAV